MKLRACVYILVAMLGVWQSAAQAKNDDISHSPPMVEVGKPLELSVDGKGIKRIRALCSDLNGVKVINLNSSGDAFKAPIKFGNLSVIKYRFNWEDEAGLMHLSKYFYIRQPSSKELERRILNLSKEASTLDAREQQLRNTLHNLSKLDPKSLSGQRNKELGRALLSLGNRERESDEQNKKLVARWKQIQAAMKSDASFAKKVSGDPKVKAQVDELKRALGEESLK